MSAEKSQLYDFGEKFHSPDVERGTTPSAPPDEEEGEVETLRAESFPGSSKEAEMIAEFGHPSDRHSDPEYGRPWPWPKYDYHGTDLDWEALKLCGVLVGIIVFLIVFILYFIFMDPHYTTFRRKIYH